MLVWFQAGAELPSRPTNDQRDFNTVEFGSVLGWIFGTLRKFDATNGSCVSAASNRVSECLTVQAG